MSIYHHKELFSPFAVNASPSHQGIGTNKSKNQPSSSLFFLDTELLLLLMFMMNNVLLFVVTIELSHVTLYQVRSQCRRQGVMAPTSISEPKKVQQIQFQTSGTLLFTGVQKLCKPEIS